MPYNIHIRRKDKKTITERMGTPGRMPKEGETTSVQIGDQTIKVKITSHRQTRGLPPVAEADEI